jgi:hypothetical protein
MFLTPKSKKIEDKLALQNQVLMIHDIGTIFQATSDDEI